MQQNQHMEAQAGAVKPNEMLVVVHCDDDGFFYNRDGARHSIADGDYGWKRGQLCVSIPIEP